MFYIGNYYALFYIGEDIVKLKTKDEALFAEQFLTLIRKLKERDTASAKTFLENIERTFAFYENEGKCYSVAEKHRYFNEKYKITNGKNSHNN